MDAIALGRRFLESTRGQVVLLLRRGARTVEELAQALGLTDNAVRSHLAALERDGLVRRMAFAEERGRGSPLPYMSCTLTPTRSSRAPIRRS